MELIHSPEIRKITIGAEPLNNGFTAFIDQLLFKGNGGFRVSKIVEDSQNYINFGVLRYYIYIKAEGQPERKWKSYMGIPVSLEYDTKSEITIIS